MKRITTFFMSTLCALCIFGAANAQDINQATELFNKGVVAFQGQDYASALESFTQALAISEQLGDEGEGMTNDIQQLIPDLHLRLGQGLAQASKIDEAMLQLQKAIETAAKYKTGEDAAENAQGLIKQLHLKIATDFLSAKEYTQAIAAFQTVVAEQADNATAFLYLGMACNGAGQEAEAIAAFEKAIELGDKNAPAQLCNIYLKEAQEARKAKNDAKAYEVVKKALEILPGNISANQIFGQSAFALKKYAEAIPALDKVLASNPAAQTKNGVIYMLAQCYEGLGKNAEACGYYKQLVGDANYKQMAEHKIANVLKCN
jgi:Predicted N-acetylglucosaminyl transferase